MVALFYWFLMAPTYSMLSNRRHGSDQSNQFLLTQDACWVGNAIRLILPQIKMHPRTLTVLTAIITRATLDLFDKRTQRISTLVFIFPSTDQPFFLGASMISAHCSPLIPHLWI